MSLPSASRDHQPSAVTAPLLEAVRQRQSAVASGLICHWVHRHGLSGLDRFRSHVLIPELGGEAAAWLDALLEIEPGSESRSPERSGAFDQQPGAAVVLPAPEAVTPFSAVGVGPAADAGIAPDSPVSSSGVAGISPPVSTIAPVAAAAQAVLDLHARAEAAVDAAFAAMEINFLDAGGSLVADGVDLAQVPAPDPSVPLADPAWWSLPSASAPLDQRQGEPSDLEPSRFAEARTRDRCSAENTPAGSQDDLDQPSAVSPDQATDGETAPRASFSALWRRLDRRRSEGMLQLRGVLRDCLEETIAPLRAHQEPVADTTWELPAAPLSPLPDAPAEQQVPLSLNAAQQENEPSPRQVVVRGHALPVAPATDLRRDPLPQARTPASLMDRLTRGRPTVENRRGDSRRNRPAPAPAALSDLRAWLPDASDLPRAS